MTSKVEPIVKGWELTPHLISRDGTSLIEFYKKAFGAELLMLMPGPDGTGVLHASLRIGNGHFMLSDETPEPNGRGAPVTMKCTTVSLYLYVENVDEVFNKALAAGATAVMEPVDMFWGDRWAMITDPDGHNWQLATHIADPTPEEMQEAARKMHQS